MKAGLPYRIRPTDVLASPIVLEHVSITTSEPQTITTDGYLVTGTFQKTDEAPAFSATITEDPDAIKALPQRGSGEGASWYDLSGKPANPLLQSGSGKGAIYVTKGRKVRK